MPDIPLMKKLVRKVLSSGLRPPFPIHIIADIARRTGNTPWVVDLCSQIEYEDQRKLTWQPWEVAWLKTHYELPDEELARVLGRSVESVRGKRISLGLHHPRGRHVSVQTRCRLGGEDEG